MKLAAAALLLLLASAGDGPDFDGLTWVDARPDLRGKVALVRWWTNGCPLCAGSAPALADLSKKVPVVSVYHPKPPRDVDADQVRGWAREIKMPGLLAVDRDWKVLDRWMPPAKRSFTSLSFLLDRKGRVRHVHSGGEITAEDAARLSQQIDALLAEE